MRRKKWVICPISFARVASILEVGKDVSLQRLRSKKEKTRMIRNPQWFYGFGIGTLLLFWAIVFLFVLSSYLPMGPGFALLFLTIGIFILIALLMLLFVFFRKTRLISFGLALPLLVLQIGMIVLMQVYDIWMPWMRLLVNLPCSVALLTVGIVYLTRNHPSSG